MTASAKHVADDDSEPKPKRKRTPKPKDRGRARIAVRKQMLYDATFGQAFPEVAHVVDLARELVASGPRTVPAAGGKAGRPTYCTPQITEAACMLVSVGWSLARIGQLDFMPEAQTMYIWSMEPEDGQPHRARFAKDVAMARRSGADFWADLGLKRVFECPRNKDAAAVVRLQLQACRDAAAIRDPERYGSAARAKLTGDGDDNSVTVNVYLPDNARADGQRPRLEDKGRTIEGTVLKRS